MLSERAISRTTDYWGRYFGCPPELLFSERPRVISHAGELSGYRGIFALYRNGGAIVSLPPDRAAELAMPARLAGIDPGELVQTLAHMSVRVVGPAYIGYAERISAVTGDVQVLTRSDRRSLERLQAQCDSVEWEHGGTPPDASATSGVFVGEELAAVASYELWDDWIAQISVITHPGFRGRGFGRLVVAHIAARALLSGRIPQYRTLDSNAASIRIAQSLGFVRYATSVAIRLAT